MLDMSQEPRKSSLRHDYTAISSDYDEARFSGWSGEFLSRADATIVQELVALVHPSVVADIPIGTGRVAEYLQSSNVQVIGCDLTLAMLDRTRKRNPPNLRGLVQCDASSLPFSDNSLDCITCLRFFHLFPPHERHHFVSEFERVLRPGGYLIVSFTNGWYAGGLNWIRKAIGQRTVFFQYRHEMARLFRGWSVLALRGNFLPFQRYLSKCAPLAERLGFILTSLPPFNRLCWERFYLLRLDKK